MKKKRKRWLIIVFIMMGVYLGRVVWINVKFKEEYPIQYHKLNDVVMDEDVSYTIRGFHVCQSIEALYQDYGREAQLKPVEEAIAKYLETSGVEYYLIVLELDVANETETDVPVSLMKLNLAGEFWYQVAQFSFAEAVGDLKEDYFFLKPGEARTLHLVFQFRDEGAEVLAYKLAKDGPLYVDLSDSHVWNRIVLQ